jgi:hypothetical protein
MPFEVLIGAPVPIPAGVHQHCTSVYVNSFEGASVKAASSA